MQPYPFYDLHRLNRWLLPMLVISGVLTIVGFFHGIYSLYGVADVSQETLISALLPEDQSMLKTDGYIRASQILATLIALTFFFVVWLYFAARNLVAIYEERHHSLANSMIIFTRLMLGIFFALRMMIAMWRRSVPVSHEHRAENWLVPLWWVLLIAANICKIISVYTLTNADQVGVWVDSYSWMTAAYSLYFPLYILTWRLALAFTHLQSRRWDQREKEVDEILGETFHVGGRKEKRRWHDPYPRALDALSLLWRNLKGPSKKNPENIQYISRKTTANDIIPEVTVGFGGDVMMMFGKPWAASESLKAFFAPCDAVMLNMEGVVTDCAKKGPDQKHERDIITQLADMFPAEKTWLSFANNHAGDFGPDECDCSADQFSQAGFHRVGLRNEPFADLHPSLRVIAATQWSNRHDGDKLAWLDETPEQYRRDDAFNLLFPHWAYEMECYPRPWAVTHMKRWLRLFDGVIGHHSHTPQPLALHDKDGVNALAAYSLGGFCFGLTKRNAPGLMHYGYGAVVKVTFGRLRDNPERFAVGEIEWQFVECFPREDGVVVSDLVDQIPYITVN